MKWLALAAIRLYQRTISQVLPPSCRFVPSCSEYGYEAIARYGIIRGGAMAIWRILRCNPWGGHGYDPVPDVTKRAVESRQKQEITTLKLVSEDESHGTNSQSSVLSPQSFTPALTPHAPGHSLTEGLL
jgi:uncharacterized protein